MADVRPPISSSRLATGDIAKHSFADRAAGLRRRRGAVLPAVGLAEPRGARGAGAGAAGRASPRPRSGRRTPSSTRPRSPRPWANTAHRSCATPTTRRRRSWPRPRRARPPCCARRRSRSRSSSRAPSPRRPSGWPRWSCSWPTRSKRRASRASASSPTPSPRARRSSQRRRTRGARCSSKCRRRAGACWPTSRHAGGRSGSRSSSCARHGTRWRRRCTACATGWTRILSHLDRTDEEARAAAVAVAEQFRLHGGPDEPHDQDALEEVIGDAPDEGPAPAVRVIEVGRRGRRGRGRRAAGDERADDVDGGGECAPSVDELFARIRAGSDEHTRRTAGRGGPEPATEASARGRRRRPWPVVVVEPVEGGEEAAAAGAGRRADRAARRAARPGDGAAQPHGEAGAGRRPEPAARPHPQHADRSAATSCSGPKRSTVAVFESRGARAAGRGVRRRARRSAEHRGRAPPTTARSSSRRPAWPTSS